MARNDNLNVRLNAQANLTNIDGIKKDLQKVMSSINLDKSVETNLNKIMKRMEGLGKAFENISKKDVFNTKDIDVVSKKTQELQSTIKEISSIMDGISMDTMVKSSEQYKKLMKDINEETKKLKDNFNKSTGLDYDKEIKGIENLKNNIKELKKAKEELQKTGVDTEYRRLLDEQNSKLDEQRQKLQNLKSLQAEIVAYQNQMAKSKGFDDYASLQKLATTRTNKSDYVQKGLANAETKEAEKLTAEYAKLEEQLKKIDQYKNQASKTRAVKKISEQLGIDAKTVNDLDKIIQKMKELTNITARTNVNQNNSLKTQLTEQYNQLVLAKNAAKEYIDEIERGANARVAMNAMTNVRTTSGLSNEISNITALLNAASTDDNGDSLLTQAQQTNTNAINALDGQIQKLGSLFTNLDSTMKAIVGLESQEKEFLSSTADSLKSIDQDTTTISNDIKGEGTFEKTLTYDKKVNDVIDAGKSNAEMLINKQVPDINKLFDNGGFGTLRNELEYLFHETMPRLKENSINGQLDLSKISDTDFIEVQASILKIKGIIDEQLPIFQKEIHSTEDLLKAREKYKEALEQQLKLQQAAAKVNPHSTKKQLEGQISIQDYSNSKIEGTKNSIAQETNNIASLKSELEAYQQVLYSILGTKQELQPVLDNEKNLNMDIEAAIKTLTQEQARQLDQEDSYKKAKAENNSESTETVEKLREEQEKVAALKQTYEQQIQTKMEATQRIAQMTQELQKQSIQLQQASAAQRTFNETIGQIGKTVGTYVSLNYIVNQIFSTIRSGMGTIKQMDDSITQIGVVTNKTSQEVWSSFSTYNAQAKRLKTTTTQLLDATKLYYQQGLNTAEVNSMVEATAIAAALGEVEMAEAADTLTAIMNGYEMSATKAMEVTDKISAVGADSAADFGELSTAIEKVASSAATAGIDLDHLLGYLGKMIEVTREAPTNIGSAMKTIVARMAELKTDPTKALEDGTDVNKVQTALRTVGIELFNTEGQMRELDDVIDELGGKWNNLSRNSQAYLATVIAGNRQQSRFLALMNDYDRTMELVTSSTDSAGRSSQQFRNYSTGLESSLNKVKAEAEDFYASLTSGNNAIKGAYDLIANLLGVVNKLGPALTFAGAGLSTFVAKFAKIKNELKNEKAIESISNNIAQQLENDRNGSVSLINSAEMFNGVSGKKKFGQKGMATNIFESMNKKDIKELNTLIDAYNQGLFTTEKQAINVTAITQQQAKAIDELAQTTGRNVQESAAMYIQNQKQTLGVKALTAAQWANVAAQAAMTVGITLIIAGVVKLISWLSDMNANLREQATEAAEAAQKASDEANSLETLVNKYEKLTKKLELTADEKEDLKSVTDELIDQYPDLLAGLDSEGKAYLKNTEAIKEYLKQKKIEAAEKNIKANKAKIISGDSLNNEIVGFWGGKKNTEHAYTDEQAEAMKKAQQARDEIPYFFNNDTTNLMFEGSANPDVAPYVSFVNSRDTADHILQGKFDNYLDQLSDVVEKYYPKQADKLKQVIQYRREFLQEGQNGIKELNKDIIQDQQQIAIAGKNLTSEQETLVNSMTKTFTQELIDTKQQEFGDDTDGFRKWLEDNQKDLSDGIVNVLTKASTGANSKKVQKAYDDYIQAQADGLSVEEINNKRNSLFDLLKKTAKTDKDKELVEQLYQSQVQAAQKDLDESIKQTLGSLKIDENNPEYSKYYEQVKTIFEKQNSAVRAKIFDSISEIMNNDDLFNGNTQQRDVFAQKMITAVSNLTSDKDLGPIFQEELNKLDINNAVDVKAFKDKWNESLMTFADKVGMSDEEKKMFIEKLIPDPGTIMEDVVTAIKTDLTNGSTLNEQGFDELFAGEYDLTDALDDGFSLGDGDVIGDKFAILTSKVVEQMDDANDKLKDHIEELKMAAVEQAEEAAKEIAQKQLEIANIKQTASSQGRDLTVAEKATVEKLQDEVKEREKTIQQSSKELQNTRRLNEQLAEQVRKRQLLSKQAFFNDYNRGVNEQIQSLKDLASAYDDIKNGELSQLDIIEMIANNTDLLTAVYVNERGELALNKNALEELAKAKIKQAITDGQVKIAQLENLKAQIETDQMYTDERRACMEDQVQQDKDITKNVSDTTQKTQKELQKQASQWDSWVNTLQQNVLPAFGTFLSNMLGGLSKFKTKSNTILQKVAAYMQSINDGIQGKARNVDDMMYINDKTYTKELNATGSAKNKDGVLVINLDHQPDNSADDTVIDLTPGAKSQSTVDKFDGYKDDGTAITGTEYKDRIQKQIDEIKAVNAALQKMYDNGTILENISQMGSSKKNKNEFKAYMEYFEKFYNYIKKIQNIEAKINRLREKRNIIDSNKNYYIKDLQKENDLLANQAVLYNQYINAQKGYLAELRNQISSSYGDLAYFDDEGLMQLKVSQVWISSESQEDRIKEFQRLMEEYESQYETMQDNETKLYEIQNTQLKNITSMYDKLLQRLSDVKENLEFMQSISEHKITMAYGDLETLDLLNDKLLTSIDLWSNASNVVSQLEGDMKIINDQVKSSQLGQFLQWDNDLNQYRITDSFYDNLTQQEWEGMGADWAEVTTWVTKTAKESEEVATKWREAKQDLMSAEETLKSIVDDRLSKINDLLGAWAGEFTSLFDVIQNHLDKLGTKRDLFGSTPERIQQQYEATAAAAALAKANVQELSKQQKKALEDITKQYGEYVTVVGDSAYINETAIKESKTLSESEKAVLLEKIAVYNNITDALDSSEDKLFEYMQQLKEFEENKRDAIISIRTEIHDQLREQDQEELDDLQKKYDEMQKLDTEYYNSLKQKIEDARNTRSINQEQLQTDQMRAKIAVMQKDNTSQYNQQLIDLQKQLNEQLQKQADDEVNRELERIQREQQERQEDRDLQLQQMENLITFKDENGIYWQEAEAMWEAGRQEVEDFLAARYEQEDIDAAERQQKLDERNEQIDQGVAELSKTQFDKMDTNNAETSKINQQLEQFFNNPVRIVDGNITSSIGNLKIDVDSQLGTTNGRLSNINGNISSVSDALNRNITGLNSSIVDIGNSRQKLWDWLKTIYNEIYAGNHNTSSTGIINSGSGSGSGSSSSGGYSGGSSSSGSSSYSNGGGDGVARVGDSATFVNGWYYYDSNGTRPAGHQYQGKQVYITNYAPGRAKPYHISTGTHLGSGDLGWLTLEQLRGYKTGGYVDFTGPTMVHGTKTKPEAFLNAKQTALFENLRDSLTKKTKTSLSDENTYEETVQIENVNINVQEVADTDSIDKIIGNVKQSIYKDATNGNNMKLRRR